MRPDRERLLDIQDALDSIKETIAGCSESEFLVGGRVYGAAAYYLSIVGEAVSRLSPELKASHPMIEWRDIVGLRNLLVHASFGIDRTMVWRVASAESPLLREQIARILEAELEE